jgi:hypothetical protein
MQHKGVIFGIRVQRRKLERKVVRNIKGTKKKDIKKKRLKSKTIFICDLFWDSKGSNQWEI